MCRMPDNRLPSAFAVAILCASTFSFRSFDCCDTRRRENFLCAAARFFPATARPQPVRSGQQKQTRVAQPELRFLFGKLRKRPCRGWRDIPRGSFERVLGIALHVQNERLELPRAKYPISFPNVFARWAR